MLSVACRSPRSRSASCSRSLAFVSRDICDPFTPLRGRRAIVMGGSAMNQDSTDTGATSTPSAARCGSWMAPSRRGLIRANAGLAAGAAAQLLVRRFQNNAPMSSGCIVDFVTPGVDDGLVIDVGNERHQALLELVFGADADVAQDRTRQL